VRHRDAREKNTTGHLGLRVLRYAFDVTTTEETAFRTDENSVAIIIQTVCWHTAPRWPPVKCGLRICGSADHATSEIGFRLQLGLALGFGLGEGED